MEPILPPIYLLNGSDYFQVFLDKHHRRYGELGNVSRLVLFLNGRIDVARLERRLNDIELLPWMASMRLSTSFLFKFPKWQVKSVMPIAVIEHEENFAEVTQCKSVFDRDINPASDAPIQFDLVNVKNQQAFILSWNHIAMDARGAEILMERLAKDFDMVLFDSSAKFDLSWKERLKEIQAVKQFLIPRIKDGLNIFQSKKLKRKTAYRTIQFNSNETELLDRVADSYKVGVAKSTFYLAAVQSAFADLSQNDLRTIWVPVPQDQRRKGQIGPVVSNQVSFMFYGIKGNMTSMPAIIKSLREQMINQMRERLPNSYHVMMDSMRRFPAWLYRRLVASPTKGALASFFYSDTGHSVKDLTSFFGIAVDNAVHFPPNSAFPGLTIIFMRTNKGQQVICGFPADEESTLKMDKFETKLRRNLLSFE